MLILALDTTTRAGSVAVTDGERVLAVVEGDAARTHGERLPGELDRALAEAGCTPRDVGLLAVASGPGAFTGLRIGLAAMQGLAMVLERPVIGISALEALAAAAARGHTAPVTVTAWMDAQRGEVFAATYDAGPGEGLPRPRGLPVVGPPATLLAALAGTDPVPAVFIGDGAGRYRDDILSACPEAVVLAGPPALAPIIGWLAAVRAARGEAGPPHALQPLYVRRSDAELARLGRSPQ